MSGTPNFEQRFIALLWAGGSSKPAEQLKPFGIDISDPAFWDQGFDRLRELLDLYKNS